MSFGKRTNTPQSIDRRHAIRRVAAEKAKLAFDRGNTFLDCTIVDISEIGARVRLVAEAKVPQRLYVVRPLQRIAHEARVVWSRSEFLGLQFTRDHDLRRPTTPELDALRQACADA